MKKFYILTLTAITAALVACNSSDSDSASATDANAAVAAADADAALEPSGETAVVYIVEDRETTADDLTHFPALAEDVAAIEGVTEVRETEAGTFDLYAGSNLVMVLRAIANGGIEVVSAPGLEIDSVTLESSDADEQELAEGVFTFGLSECRTVSDDDDQDKEGQDQDQEQDKGEDKEECAEAIVKLFIKEVKEDEKQEQEQDKGEDKDEDKDQDQDQEQDKGEDKGSDQDQDGDDQDDDDQDGDDQDGDDDATATP